MKVLQGNFNTAGTAPNVTAQDASGPTATDGTFLDEAWVTDIFGWAQYALDAVGDTPDDTNELVSNASAANSLDGSQILLALRGIMGYPGELVQGFWAGTIPTNLRVLEMLGQLIAVADYPDLVDATWCGSANNATAEAFYRTNSGDTVRADAGTHMRLPDAQGCFFRGADSGASVDPDGASRIPGSTQESAVAEHNHKNLFDGSNESGSEYQVTTTVADTGSTTIRYLSPVTGTDFYTGNGTKKSISAVDVIDEESRPTNIQVRNCIRY
jgi:hypothetical protein